jgi:hypothetical protein
MQNQREDLPLFPKHRPGAAPEARIGGTLKLDDKGCVRIVTGSEHRGWTVIWPPDYSLGGRDKNGRLTIVDASGKLVGREGDDIILSGGLIGESLGPNSLTNSSEEVLERRCPGGFVYAGRVM